MGGETTATGALWIQKVSTLVGHIPLGVGVVLPEASASSATAAASSAGSEAAVANKRPSVPPIARARPARTAVDPTFTTTFANGRWLTGQSNKV